MRAHSLAVVALMAVAATPPAVAGVVYAPAANFTQDGLQRRSELVLSNLDTAAMRVAMVRFVEEGVAGTPLPTGGTYPQLWTAAGRTQVHAIPAATLPVGKAGMLEVFPGFGDILVGARLVYEKQGVYSVYADLPAITSSNLVAANGTVYLQGLEHDSAAGILTDLGLFNLGTSPAACTWRARMAARKPTMIRKISMLQKKTMGLDSLCGSAPPESSEMPQPESFNPAMPSRLPVTTCGGQ